MKKIIIFLMLTGFISFALVNSAADGISAFENDMLKRHNYHRAKHGVPPLKWNKRIASFAKQWARTNARRNRMFHRQPNKYGENIYWISGGSVSGSSPVDAWYSEIRYYSYSRPGFSYKTGHFTQVIWKGSTEIGCGKAKSYSGGTYVVCNYNPPGNYRSRFRKNVPPRK